MSHHTETHNAETHNAETHNAETPNETMPETDVVILGGTPGGIAAAISTTRSGNRVVLVESHAHLGGMSSSGLGKSDVEKRHLIGGVFQEFTRKIHQYYLNKYGPDSEDVRLCESGYYFEPCVAEQVFAEMLADCSGLTILTQYSLVSTVTTQNRLTEITIEDQHTQEKKRLRAHVFIDATYEGDLLAAAGAEYRLGREARTEFHEQHAGVVYFDYQRHEFLPGTTGEGDERLPAYTYRLCLTTRANNSFQLTQPPANYDRRDFLGYLDDLSAGRLAGPKTMKPGRGYEPAHFNTTMRAFSVTPLPNGKTDVNINPRPLGFPFPEENRNYVEGDASTRQQTCERIRELTLGLLWFLQNDSAIAPAHRKLAKQYHLPLDEFSDNEHFPFQLYIREARRLKGEFTLTEREITQQDSADIHVDSFEMGKGENSTGHSDTVAIGEFPIDSFPCRKRQPTDTVVLEGYLGMLDYVTRPYEIPYRMMIPQTIDGLIVPVAASTTHVAFSSIRMEPTWMALGQAAGVAAHLAIQHQVSLRNVPLAELKEKLVAGGQVLEHAPSFPT